MNTNYQNHLEKRVKEISEREKQLKTKHKVK